MTCRKCHKDWPDDHFRGPRSRQCRACRAAYKKAWDKKNQARNAAYHRAYYHETMARPALAESERERKAEHNRRYRERNRPEYNARQAELRRTRYHSDPEYRARYLEAQRMSRTLREERKGRKVTRRVKVTMPSHRVEEVIPAGPLTDVLVVHMREQGHDNKSLARAAGVDDSNISKLLHGKKDGVYLSVADKILTALDLPMKLVYPEL